MKPVNLLLIILLSCFAWLLPGAHGLAAEGGNSPAVSDSPAPAKDKPLTVEDYARQLDLLEGRLDLAMDGPAEDEGESALDSIALDLLPVSQFAQGCITAANAEHARIQETITSLGAVDPHEDKTLQNSRKELAQQKKDVEKRLSQCRLINLRTTQAQEIVSSRKQGILRERLLASDESAFTLLLHALQHPTLWATETQQIFSTLSSLPVNFQNVYRALLYGLAGLMAGFAWSLFKRREYRNDVQRMVATSPTMAAVWGSIIHLMPWILLFGLVTLSLHYNDSGVPALNGLAPTLLLFSVSFMIISAMLRPSTPGKEAFTPVIPETSRKLYFWARLLLFAILLGMLFHSQLFDTNPPSTLVGLIRIGLGTFACLGLIRLLWLLRVHLVWLQQYRLYWVGSLVLGVAIAALWLGYRNLFSFLFTNTFDTLLIVLVGWLLLRIPDEVFDGLDEGRAAWQQALRSKLGLADKQLVPGLIWLRLLHAATLFGLLALLLLRVWGVSEDSIRLMFSKLVNGFQIGSFVFEPVRIISGLMLMALLLGLSHLLKSGLANYWLHRTNLSRGAKETTVTITGYVGIILAIVIGLSVAGIEFTNLAIIAGALSVGIGFGLQNIVNNFISGLILLFERPIRRGDWIKVGVTEGYVRDISIRSTIIQTFDRSDIIVPNSELIANQVTNMMLSNHYGRVIIPVGVAYGSDVDLVMRTLYQIAEKHPAILREYGELKIQVFFLNFGDSTLNFELRCHIRDVEKRMNVISELNLAIYRAFCELGVEIPFPQRTIHHVYEADAAKQARPAQAGPVASAKTKKPRTLKNQEPTNASPVHA